MKSDESGLLIGVGNRNFLTLYDVRFDRKLMSIRTSYSEPIHSIYFLQDHSKSILFGNQK